jgi:hypothetical protein
VLLEPATVSPKAVKAVQLEERYFLEPDHVRVKSDVTQALDRVYSQESSVIDPVLMQMQIASLPNDDW